MRRGPRLALALALIAAAPARAYVRTTTAGGNPTQGACLYWPQGGLTYRVNASAFSGAGCGDGSTPPSKAAADLLRASFQPWTAASRSGVLCGGFAFADGGDTQVTVLGNDRVNLVVFRKGLCTSFASVDPDCAAAPLSAAENRCIAAHNCWSHGDGNIIALTTSTFVQSTGKVVDVDTELHAWNGDASVQGATGWYFTCAGAGALPCARPPYGASSCIYIDIGTTMTHEAGHMLGLDHVRDTSSVMFPNTSPGLVDRTLGSDDVAGVCDIYPAGAPPSPTAGCLGQPAPPASSGCSSGGGGGAVAALALVVLALRRRPAPRRLRGAARPL